MGVVEPSYSPWDGSATPIEQNGVAKTNSK
jgi:hypothetical protein